MSEARAIGSAARALDETEQWFLRRGVPHFIDRYSASRDVLTRSAPFLTVVFLIEVVNAPKASFPLWLSVVAVVGGLGILLGAWAVANRIRGRPMLARPVEVGGIELAVFVLAPALLPLVFGGQLGSALGTAVFNLVVVGVAYVVTSYGLVPMTRWGLGKTIGALNTVATLFVRALPLVLIFVTFLFLTEEVWRVNAQLTGIFYVVTLAFFPLLALLFATLRVPEEVAQVAHFESWSEVIANVADTPVAPLVRQVAEPKASAPLGRRQWVNIGLVVLFSQGLQVVLVMVMVFAVLVGFGTLVATEVIVTQFLGGAPNVLASFELADRQMVVTEELLRVAGFLAVFSGFSFAISVLTDQTYRDEFLADVVDGLRQAFAVRAVYLATRATMD